MYETNTKSVNQKIQWEFCMMTKGDKKWIKNWKPTGGNMKGSRLKDVLDEQPIDKVKWDMIFGKLKKLATAIEMYYGSEMD